MTPTDTRERGLEDTVLSYLTGYTRPGEGAPGSDPAAEVHEAASRYGGNGWILGNAADYDREFAVDLHQLGAFLAATQPKSFEAFELDHNSPARRKFLSRLQGEITKHGVVKVLRDGIASGPHQISLYFATPTPGNEQAAALHAQNRFSVSRQLRYSRDETRLALDLCLFVNGLPVFTFELKNRLTRQNAQDAIAQYENDRDPAELLFQFGRCLAHFAVDEDAAFFCTHLQKKESRFLPFNRGNGGGAGNPPNAFGLRTDYLWLEILRPASVADILENFAQILITEDPQKGGKKKTQIFPRYHQLEAVRRLLQIARTDGPGHRYLIQHSAGSGKSNSIAWLAHQLTHLKNGQQPIFDTIVVVTDRRVLDRQLCDTIRGFTQVRSTVAHAQHSGDLKRFLQQGKKIVISTLQKFPFVLAEIGNEHRDRHFAIVIDEAHSSQGGNAAGALNRALSEQGEVADESPEDRLNRLIEARKLLSNASYFAFTATPKPKTLELFGQPYDTPDGTRFRPFHTYSMKQAIEEGFILDVLARYTPIDSYYKLIKKIEDDPEFDTRRAQKKLRAYVEGHQHAIDVKAEIIAEHFHQHVYAPRKIGGEARAMVVTSGIHRAIQYFDAISEILRRDHRPYRAIVAFSGEHEWQGKKVTEASLNGFASNLIEEKIAEKEYRLLICADKFQTGYDQPLLHTMYVDKTLAGIQAVQTLSRLNRSRAGKSDVFVLDFCNDSETIRAAFSDYYSTTLLAEATDPDQLHDLENDLRASCVYTQEQVDALVERYLAGAKRPELDPLVDVCVELYRRELGEDAQVAFKGKAKTFVRTYGFLSAILPYTQVAWEKLAIFLQVLIAKLPAPTESDLSRGVLEAIDMDSYRIEKRATIALTLSDEDAELAYPKTSGSGHKNETQLDRLSAIVEEFNRRWGNIAWQDEDRLRRRLFEEIPQKVKDDQAYSIASQKPDRQNAKIELDRALHRVMISLLTEETELYKKFSDDPEFRRDVADRIFELTYTGASSAA